MPWSDDHRAISDTVAGWGQGVNPDGRPGAGQDDLPPDLFSRMLKGELTPHQARQEWAERAPSQRAFNDRIRAQAKGGFVADTAAVMSQADTAGSPVAVRDVSTGQFSDLGEAARAAGSKSIPGGLVPTEQAPPVPSANSKIRDAYYRKQQRRGGG